MRKSMIVTSGFLVIAMCTVAFATSWTAAEIQCPLCNKTITVKVIVSYGSYIYRWPSKFQMIFWPSTTNNFLYFCKHCHLTAFMEDFKKIPPEKFDAIKESIVPLIKRQPDKPYYEIPMDYRLNISEAVYMNLERDDAFWCSFYRIKGYHLDIDGKTEDAIKARLKALALAEKMLSSKADNPIKKELTLIIGSMQYFTDQKKQALVTLKKVSEVPVPISKTLSAEQANNATTYLNEVAEEFLQHLQEGKPLPE